MIAVFALIFLFYTNSFLMRRRNHEFGLYHVLGMSKRNIARVLVWETAMIFAASLLFGTALGVGLSKLAELVLLRLLQQDAAFEFAMAAEPFVWTGGIFAVIFLLLLGKSLLQLWRTDTLRLLHSENYGERPPKANWIGAVLGVLLLGAAYWLAVSIKDPITAMVWFFIAVIMVIVATYLLLISGSVALCRVLQRNKRYYYRPNHFISVSSMTYRMKRNGAGLASICILSTMVLVMISSTMSLYIGMEDSLAKRYGRDIAATVMLPEPQDYDAAEFEDVTAQVLKLYDDQKPEHLVTYRYFCLGDTVRLVFLPIEDYNAILGTQLTLGPDEALADRSLGVETLRIVDLTPLHVMGAPADLPAIDSDDFFNRSCIVLGDYDGFINELYAAVRTKSIASSADNESCWKIAFDLAAPKTTVGDDMGLLEQVLLNYDERCWGGVSFRSLATDRLDFYTAYGGLFFVGILLSIVFILAAVLIIYYKQVSEGYEDQARFSIMQKVGMDKRAIRKSINAQILLVFFLPLLLAGLHLTFAFPLVWRILQLFMLSNLKLLILVTISAYLVFALLYTLVYRLTSNAYYNIVSGAKGA